MKLSTLGLDATSEGPLSKSGGSTYLVSYRYGLTKLATDLGLAIFEGDQVNLSDLLFKLNFPLSSQSSLSVWGLGHGTSATWTGTDGTSRGRRSTTRTTIRQTARR